MFLTCRFTAIWSLFYVQWKSIVIYLLHYVCAVFNWYFSKNRQAKNFKNILNMLREKFGKVHTENHLVEDCYFSTFTTPTTSFYWFMWYYLRNVRHIFHTQLLSNNSESELSTETHRNKYEQIKIHFMV